MSIKSKVPIAAALVLTLARAVGAVVSTLSAPAPVAALGGRHLSLLSAFTGHPTSRRSFRFLKYASGPVPARGHDPGGDRAVSDLRRVLASRRPQIEDETARGSRKHQRLPRWTGHAAQLALLVADAGLLLYFFAGITGVGWTNLMSAKLAFAMLLAVIVTTLSYGYLAVAGSRRQRDNRGNKGHLVTGAYALTSIRSLRPVHIPQRVSRRSGDRAALRPTAIPGRCTSWLSALAIPRSSMTATRRMPHGADRLIVQRGWTG
jgi:hypothetical protein